MWGHVRFVVYKVTLWQVIFFWKCNAPTPRTHLDLYFTLIRRTNGRGLSVFQEKAQLFWKCGVFEVQIMKFISVQAELWLLYRSPSVGSFWMKCSGIPLRGTCRSFCWWRVHTAYVPGFMNIQQHRYENLKYRGTGLRLQLGTPSYCQRPFICLFLPLSYAVKRYEMSLRFFTHWSLEYKGVAKK
jgi:hypothetical protein